jgi:hypothetical protein
MKNILIAFLILNYSLCHSVVVVPTASIAAANVSISESTHNQQQALLSNVKTSSQVVGIISCEAYYEDVNAPSAYHFNGCRTRKGHVSIKRFFDRFKTRDNYEIIQVIFNDHSDMFNIYYGVK